MFLGRSTALTFYCIRQCIKGIFSLSLPSLSLSAVIFDSTQHGIKIISSTFILIETLYQGYSFQQKTYFFPCKYGEGHRKD